MVADASVFFALWLLKPLQIAAANSSSNRLANTIAVQVDLTRPGPVLESGAGTGCEVARVWFNLLPAQIWCYRDARGSVAGGVPA
jgi:hypothetical protein